jgi:hypothetical protein
VVQPWHVSLFNMNILLNIILFLAALSASLSEPVAHIDSPNPSPTKPVIRRQATSFEPSLADAINYALNTPAPSTSLPLTVDPSLLSSPGPPPSLQASTRDQNVTQTPLGGLERDLGGEDFPSPDDDVDMGDATVGNAQGIGLVGDGGNMTVGNTQVGGLVGDAGVDATVGSTHGGGLVANAEEDFTVGNAQVGGIVGDAGMDVTVGSTHGGGLVVNAEGDTTVGNAQAGGIVGDAGVDATVESTHGGGLVVNAEGDFTVGNAQAGGIVGDAGDMRVDEDHSSCDPQGVDNDQETEASGSGSIKMDITSENSEKLAAQNRRVTRSRKRPCISTRLATDSEENDDSNSGTSTNPIDVDLYVSVWEHRISKDFVSISVCLF